MVRDAVHAFDILRGVLRRIRGEAASERARVDVDAMFVWSSMHGLAIILQADVMSELRLARTGRDRATPHVMLLISRALAAGA